jgi:ABC-2 type transport system permease protein
VSAALTAYTLWRREIVRFLRQPNRIIGAIGSPVLFWVLIGSGVGRSFRPSGFGETVSYLEYVFPGTLLMILLFTAIFSTISIIEDRREGFLQSVLVAPAPRIAVVLGKVLGGTTLAVAQALLLLALGVLAGIPMSVAGLAPTVGLLILIGAGMTGLGFFMAWRMDSIQGFHALMNLVLFPMWLLSGALFPVSGAAGWLAWIMRANPLTYGLDALRAAMHAVPEGAAVAPVPVAVAVTAAFAAATVGAASWTARRVTRGDLR